MVFHRLCGFGRERNEKNITQKNGYHCPKTHVLQVTVVFLCPFACIENDIADALELLKKEERTRLYTLLDSEMLAGILEYSEKLPDYMGQDL